MVPADADAEPQPTAGDEIDVGRLSGHEGGLSLREDQDPGGELDSFGDPGEVGEHDEWVVERVALGVRAGEFSRSVGVDGAEDVVVGEEVVEAQLLDRCREPPACVGITLELGLG